MGKPLHIQTNGEWSKNVTPGKKVKLHEKMPKVEIDALLERKKQELVKKP